MVVQRDRLPPVLAAVAGAFLYHGGFLNHALGQNAAATMRMIVAAAMGQDGEVVAHETSGGIRTLHAYVDGATSVADTVGGTRPNPAPVAIARRTRRRRR
jgi:hypothetical protein